MTHQKKLAFVFPGQGSQSIGMGKYLYDEFKIARTVFEECSDAISVDLKKLCFNGDEKDLALTENTQPALLTVSVATAKVLENDIGLKATITAGHSIGEYSSLVLGKVITLNDAIKSVRFRGQAMQSAVPVGQGSMIATLGLTNEQATFLCEWAVKESKTGPLSPANFNCEGQVVLSGNAATIQWLQDNYNADIFAANNLGEAKRTKLIPLQVSAPFHCSMMLPAEEKMKLFLSNIMFQDSHIPIIQNLNATAETRAANLKDNLIKQVSGSVLWYQSMLYLRSLDCSPVVECGNGSVLKGLFKKIDADYFKVFSTNSLDDLKNLETLR